MYSQKRQKGNTAEEIVVLYLKNTGFQILDQNYLRKWGEIDIVAKKLRKIHFIEVKTVFDVYVGAMLQLEQCQIHADDAHFHLPIRNIM